MDPNPAVQLAALSALIEMPADPMTAAALVNALEKLEGTADHWLPTAFGIAAIANAESFLEALVATRPPAKQGLTAASEVEASKQVNIIPNPGFEQLDGSAPKGRRSKIASGASDGELYCIAPGSIRY